MKTCLLVIFGLFLIGFTGTNQIILQINAQEIHDSPHLSIVFQLENSSKSGFVYGDTLLVNGYVEENHGLTKVGNVYITLFLEWPNATKTVLTETTTSESGDFSFDFSVSSNFLVGRYLISAEPYTFGYQSQLDNDKKIVEFIVSNGKEALFESPLKQTKSGIQINQIKCSEKLVFVLKINGISACVTQESKIKLLSRGWAIDEESSFLPKHYNSLNEFKKNLSEPQDLEAIFKNLEIKK